MERIAPACSGRSASACVGAHRTSPSCGCIVCTCGEAHHTSSRKASGPLSVCVVVLSPEASRRQRPGDTACFQRGRCSHCLLPCSRNVVAASASEHIAPASAAIAAPALGVEHFTPSHAGAAAPELAMEFISPALAIDRSTCTAGGVRRTCSVKRVHRAGACRVGVASARGRIHRTCACRVIRGIAPAVCAAPVSLAECIAVASAVIATSTSAVEYVALASAVTYVAPATADCAAPSPAAEYNGGVRWAKGCEALCC